MIRDFSAYVVFAQHSRGFAHEGVTTSADAGGLPGTYRNRLWFKAECLCICTALVGDANAFMDVQPKFLGHFRE